MPDLIALDSASVLVTGGSEGMGRALRLRGPVEIRGSNLDNGRQHTNASS